ncbi:hypothetical protein F5X97DRAFT_328897 [Nemania serpens]|nr:hypothetical protein F5X97DRAFT_328897 [Nemania serpens]
MPLPDFPPTPANLVFGLDRQLGSVPQKQREHKKRKRDAEHAAAKEANKQNAAIIKKLKLDPKAKEPVTAKQDSMEIDNREGPSAVKTSNSFEPMYHTAEHDAAEKIIKLRTLEKKSEELQGFLNQLQDAVAIGMFQLRDLKNQIATATAALAVGEK